MMPPLEFDCAVSVTTERMPVPAQRRPRAHGSAPLRGRRIGYQNSAEVMHRPTREPHVAEDAAIREHTAAREGRLAAADENRTNQERKCRRGHNSSCDRPFCALEPFER